MRIAPLCGLLGLLLACAAVSAHAESAPRRSVSYSTWLLEGDLVTARLVLPAAEAASLVGKAMPLLTTENLAKYVLDHVSVAAGGSPCEATDQGYDIGRINSLSLDSSVYGFEIIFRCPHAGTLSLNNALLFAEQPQHVDFARIERGGVHAAQLFTAPQHVLIIADEGGLPAAGAQEFLWLGSGHAWRSVEWLCALLGFFLLARQRRRLATVLVSLACGYAAALLLTAGGLQPDPLLLGAGMGFVIACSAALMVSQALRHGRPAKTAVAVARAAGVLIFGILIMSIAPELRHRPSLALVVIGFAIVGATLVGARPARAADGDPLAISILPALAALMDGLVLPGDYERVLQWGELSLRNLAAFDAGALLTEALMLAAFAALAVLLGRVFRHRIRPEEFAPVARDIAATVFAGFGSFWLLSRLY
jgi:hypothetical protein